MPTEDVMRKVGVAVDNKHHEIIRDCTTQVFRYADILNVFGSLLVPAVI
jgi:hypothetical protein